MKRKHIMTVIAGCGLIGSCLGVFVNLAGLFYTPIAYDLGIGRGTVSLTLTLYNLIHGFNGTYALQYMERFGFKRVVLFGTILQVASTYALSLCTSIAPMLLLNAIRGFAAGMIGMAVVSIMINYWFNKNSSLMTSIALGFSGIAGAILSPFISSYIAVHGWRNATVLLSIIVLCFNLPALLFPISLRPKDVGEEPYGEAEEKAVNEEGGSFDMKLFHLVFTFASLASMISAMPQHFAGIAQSYGLASAAAAMVSAAMLVNSGGKMALGALIDRFGNKTSLTLYVVLLLIGNAMMLLCREKAALIIAAALYGTSYGLAVVASSSLSREKFGMANYGKVYSRIAFGTTIVNALLNYLIGLSYDLSGSYALSLVASLLIAASLLVLLKMLYRSRE